jgi:hypothetical protein
MRSAVEGFWCDHLMFLKYNRWLHEPGFPLISDYLLIPLWRQHLSWIVHRGILYFVIFIIKPFLHNSYIYTWRTGTSRGRVMHGRDPSALPSSGTLTVDPLIVVLVSKSENFRYQQSTVYLIYFLFIKMYISSTVHQSRSEIYFSGPRIQHINKIKNWRYFILLLCHRLRRICRRKKAFTSESAASVPKYPN